MLSFRTKLMSQSRENLQRDRRMDRRMEGWKNGWKDRPYFIGPLRLRPGVQKKTTTKNKYQKIDSNSITNNSEQLQ